MSACRNRVQRAAILATFLLAAPAGAQVGPPINLLPGRAVGPVPAAERAPEQSGLGGIEVRKLQALDGSAAGTMTPVEAGFGPDLWSGLPRPLAEKLIAQLPMGAPSRAMASLARRLLLTAAPPPAGEAGTDWLALRAERLIAGGMLDDANALLALVPAGAADPQLARARAQAQLLVGDAQNACAQGPLLLGADSDPGALKLMAFCRQLAGDRAEVDLYDNLIRDSGHKDPLFSKLLSALERPGAPAPDSFKGAGPLHFAMLRAAKRDLPADAAEGAAAPVLRAIAGSDDAPAKVRLAAAERAEAAGAIGADMLCDAYAAASNAGGRAAAYQAAQRETQPQPRAKAIAAALAAARRSGDYMTQARVYAPMLREIEPQAELVWFAAEAGRALAAAGQVGRAYDWLALAQRNARPDNPDAAIAVVTLWPLLAVADDEGRLHASPEVLASWRQANDVGAPGFRERAGLLYGALEALGESVPETEWAALADGPAVEPAPAPSALVAHGLAQATKTQAQGAAALYALLALGGNGPAGASARTLADVAAVLAAARLGRDARALAVEAMIARGF